MLRSASNRVEGGMQPIHILNITTCLLSLSASVSLFPLSVFVSMFLSISLYFSVSVLLSVFPCLYISVSEYLSLCLYLSVYMCPTLSPCFSVSLTASLCLFLCLFLCIVIVSIAWLCLSISMYLSLFLFLSYQTINASIIQDIWFYEGNINWFINFACLVWEHTSSASNNSHVCLLSVSVYLMTLLVVKS